MPSSMKRALEVVFFSSEVRLGIIYKTITYMYHKLAVLEAKTFSKNDK